MSLEQEIVFELKKHHLDSEVLDTCENLSKENIFELDIQKVRVALNTYRHLQSYRERALSEKGTKKRIKQKIRDMLNQQIEEIKENSPDLISVKINGEYYGSKHTCPLIEESHFRYVDLKVISVDSIERIKSFEYCKKCGATLDETN